MKSSEPSSPSRRDFLKSSLAMPAILASGGAAAVANAASPASDTRAALPKRKLGKNGPEVTILNLGGMMSAHSPQYLDIAWSQGIRYFDTADCYIKGQSEKNVGKWLKQYPERRKDLFLVTKDHPKQPEDLVEMLDRRLEAIGTDYVDLFFIHGISPKYGGNGLEWPTSDRLKKVFAQIKASGKAKMCGFSCHDKQLVKFLNAAAEGGFVDAIMLRYNPFYEKGGDFDRALDACHKAGIGLISMKEMKPFAKAPKSNPSLEEVELTTHQALLHAVWSDPRISSICSAMENIQEIEENSLAANKFESPLPGQQREALERLAMRMPVPMCPGCPACDALVERTRYAFYDISRYVTYYEQDGNAEARDYYRTLPKEERMMEGTDLVAARDACQFHVDYPEIGRRAEEYFA